MSKNAESEPNTNDDKTFINKLLIQMKSQFNNSGGESKEEAAMAEVVQEESMETGEESAKSDCEVSEEDNNGVDKPRIVLTFRKPKNKAKQVNFRAKEVVLKRSSRRRSKDCNESVLQSAIARKEKSYNESNKPQRLTRQLKPTQKILDNIASAAVKLGKEKNERKLVDEDGCVAKKLTRNLKNGRRLKDSDSDHSGQADSNSSLSSESSNKTHEENKLCRRSLRISST